MGCRGLDAACRHHCCEGETNGFISLGDNGQIAFNLTSATSTAGLFLYIGEVGDNGEVAGSNFQLLQNPVPEPETYALMPAGLGVVAWATRRQRRT